MVADTPRIETERLVLRPLTLADLGPLHEVYGDREVMRYVGPHSESVEASEERLRRLIEHQDEHGFSLWAVTDRDTGSVMGDCGLILYAFRGPEVELAYRLAKPYWGRGYASEAAAAWLAHGLDELRLSRIVAVADPANAASRRVLEKVGMRFEGMVLDEGRRVCRYAVERER